MPKGQRIAVFIVSVILLAGIYLGYKEPIQSLDEPGIVILSALVMLSFALLFAEHFFTRPTDVIASSISILLLISPLHSLLNKLGVWYWILWAYSATVLGLSLIALILLNEQKPPTSFQNKTAAILKSVATSFGNAKFLWGMLFLLCLLFYVDSQSGLFLILVGYAAVLLFIDPKTLIFKSHSIGAQKETAVGQLFGVHSSNAFLARVFPNAPSINRFDAVGFSRGMRSDDDWNVGLVIEAYELNQERWLKILVHSSLEELSEKTGRIKAPGNGIVHKLITSEDIRAVQFLVGIVCEDTKIEKLRFEYAFNVPVQEGELLQASCEGSSVLYQVVEGITGTEQLESRNEAGVTVGEAVQLGVWNNENRSFDRYGWVPMMNTPVLKSRGVAPSIPLVSEYQIGSIPGTNFPVFINKDDAVTHHLAVLGITGSGKSVFARNLIRQVAVGDTKAICVDFTNEYVRKLADIIGGPLVAEGDADELFDAVDVIGEEMDKFANQRNRANIAASEETLRVGFRRALERFVEGDSRAALFELPDVTNTAGILDYTRWFFKVLFEMAKSGELGGNKICVVLEEAHTIIPEWNFLGIDDKRAGSVVNSISQIALQGRKYGVGFMVIAQRTANVSKTVLTQCNSVVAFQQFDRTSSEFLGNYMGKDFISSLTRLRPRHAIAVGKAFSSGTPMIFEVPEIIEPLAAEPQIPAE